MYILFKKTEGVNLFYNFNINMGKNKMFSHKFIKKNSLTYLILGHFFHGLVWALVCKQAIQLMYSFLPFPCTTIVNPQWHANDDTPSTLGHHKMPPKFNFVSEKFVTKMGLVITTTHNFSHSFVISFQVPVFFWSFWLYLFTRIRKGIFYLTGRGGNFRYKHQNK